MINNFNSLHLRESVETIIQEQEKDIIKLNQDQLYYLGEGSDSKPLKPYSFLTELIKREKGQPYDRTTLKDTGAFYSAFKVDVNSGLITFDSSDEKTQMLEKKYGNQIFGLTSENKTAYSFGIFYEELKKYITKKTGLQFM